MGVYATRPFRNDADNKSMAMATMEEKLPQSAQLIDRGLDEAAGCMLAPYLQLAS